MFSKHEFCCCYFIFWYNLSFEEHSDKDGQTSISVGSNNLESSAHFQSTFAVIQCFFSLMLLLFLYNLTLILLDLMLVCGP